MASHVSGIAIVIKAFLPTGKTLDEQFTALSIVKDAHATGDYAALLQAAKIDEVKTEQKTRRMEDEPVAVTESSGDVMADLDAKTEDASGLNAEFNKLDQAAETEQTEATAGDQDDPTPAFLKKGKKSAAA